MRNLLIATAGFLAGSGVIAALMVATSQATKVTTVRAASTTPVAASQMTSGMMGSGTANAAMSGRMMNAAPTAGTSMMAGGKIVRLTIQHVQHGCHVWSNGRIQAATMRLHMTRGERLQIMDMDVDAHQMMELGGPMRVQMGGPMMMSHGMTLSFSKKGVYRLGTHTVEMPGGGMDVKTIGPDNKLRLIVTVT